MKKFRLVLSDAAVADILEQADWYAAQSGRALAQRWENAVTTAILRAVDRPGAGTLCAFEATELSGVRRTTIPRFAKHLIFYRFDEREIFILRVVHGARDLERLLWPPSLERNQFSYGGLNNQRPRTNDQGPETNDPYDHRNSCSPGRL